MTTHTVTDAAFPAPDVVPIHWFYTMFKDFPDGFRSIVMDMIDGLIQTDTTNNNLPLNLLLTLDKRITHPNEWLRVWTSVDDEAARTPGFDQAVQLFQLVEKMDPPIAVRKCLAALSTAIDTLWARNGTTLRRTLLVYDPGTPLVTIELASAAHAIIEQTKRGIHGAYPMSHLGDIVAQLNLHDQLRIATEPIHAWSEMIRKLPLNIQSDATCRLCALISKALVPPSY